MWYLGSVSCAWETSIVFFANNVRDTNFFTNKWCGEWLLVNEKVILKMSLDENQ